MSYSQQPSMGSYYTYQTHQTYSQPLGAAEGEAFSCDAVWADAQAGGGAAGIQKALNVAGCGNITPANEVLCKELQGKLANANFRGARAADKIRAGLNQLGYGPLTLGVPWGPADAAAWKAFTSDEGLPAGPGMVNREGLCKMEDKLGGKLSKAGMGSLGWIALLIVAGAVGVSMVTKRRKKGARTGRAMVPMR